LMTAVTISIGGYDTDDRALCEIPEARKFILQFFSIMEIAEIPLSRFMQDTVELFMSCLATEMGKTVIFTETPINPTDLLNNYRLTVRQKMH